MPKKKKYGNILDVPLSANLLLLEKDWIKQRDTDLLERETALFAEYGLTRPKNLPISVQKLIKAMARELKINSFFYETEIKTAGRPKTWAIANDKILLFFIVQGFKKKYPNKTLFDIISIVANRYYPKTTARSLFLDIMKS